MERKTKMQEENRIFFFCEAEKQLFCYGRNSTFVKLTPQMIESEMQRDKSRTNMHIHNISQDGLEYFAKNYGLTYKVLYLDDCTRINDFSALEDLVNLEALCIERCRGVEKLWDLSKNRKLKILSIRGARKITQNPLQLRLSNTLEEIRFWSETIDKKYTMESLSCFMGLRLLRRIDLNGILLNDHDMIALSTLPNLEEFHFDAGMLRTEEIAWICAKYPNIYGQSLAAYSMNDPMSLGNIRICGQHKPSLFMPDDAAKLKKYVENFNGLVKKYRE